MRARGWGGCSTRSTRILRYDGPAMSRRRFPWDRLGIDATDDTAAIRKAYADALRATNVDEDIAGYAELRRARDSALWLAAQSQRDAEEPDDDGNGDELGLGDLAAPAADDGGDDDGGDDRMVDDIWDDEGWDESPRPYRPDPLAPVRGSELNEAQAQAQAAWERLSGTLYPDGAVCEEAMTLAEMEEGLAALGVLTARAEAADLAEHDALDGALAELFARTWPRSAPFVEPGDAAFHWLEEAGSLEERPALRFLNQRLKGMRFHEKVQRPDHPLHKAWVELSRPGPARLIDRLRVKRADADKLIVGIREHFPELESHLDPQRVASWDAGRPDDGAPGLVPRIIRGVFIVLLVFAFPRMIAQCTEREDSGPPLVLSSQITPAEIDAEVRNIFGDGTDMKAVEAADPKLARDLLSAIKAPEIALPLNYVRMQGLASAEVADRAGLEARAELKAIWLTAAKAQSAEACRMIVDGKLRDLSIDLGDKQRVREQGLLRQLLEAKVLSHMPKGGETRYAIPGWLVGDTLKRSGLPEERLVAAFKDPGSADRCTAETALAQAVRASARRVPDDVLKGL